MKVLYLLLTLYCFIACQEKKNDTLVNEKEVLVIPQDTNVPPVENIENETTNQVEVTKQVEKTKSIGKQMYGVVIFSTYSEILEDKVPNFSEIFIVDSEITEAEEKSIINEKISLKTAKGATVYDKNLKCFDTMREAHQYIAKFKRGTKYRPTDMTTFDSIINYTSERELLRNYHNF